MTAVLEQARASWLPWARVRGFPDRSHYVLVIGGGPQAAMRIHDLATKELPIVVVAPRICDDLADLLVEHRVTWFNRAPEPADVLGAWLVHVATGDQERDLALTTWVRSVSHG